MHSTSSACHEHNLFSIVALLQGLIRIHGQFYSEPFKKYRIEFFANKPSTVDPTGYGEGQCFLGEYEINTNNEGHSVLDTKKQFEVNLASGQCNVMPGDYITSTATETLHVDVGVYKPGGTSEFSKAIVVAQ